jgi:hypothetical protein
MSRYKTLRVWSQFLIALGIVSVVLAGFAVTAYAINVEGLWETLAVCFLGAPIALLLAAWPIAFGQALRALADIGDTVGFDTLPAGIQY